MRPPSGRHRNLHLSVSRVARLPQKNHQGPEPNPQVRVVPRHECGQPAARNLLIARQCEPSPEKVETTQREIACFTTNAALTRYDEFRANLLRRVEGPHPHSHSPTRNATQTGAGPQLIFLSLPHPHPANLKSQIPSPQPTPDLNLKSQISNLKFQSPNLPISAATPANSGTSPAHSPAAADSPDSPPSQSAHSAPAPRAGTNATATPHQT